eukprot:gnl/TRDRNA2_/TRDRNA2_62386_c0_seq1.p1 gnl/TRDRNA2_/TRDRNA2_62386_c0~~gnl/TRDRNA2_/TRDRNA2_62386_c0_seq1.p1  ORF type:complete len:270 (-),score=26.93 gnl/TRDRNA2_/TRDRNA2_62386_c0_seq1:50-859(-)
MSWMITASPADMKVAKRLQKQQSRRLDHQFRDAEKRVWTDCQMRMILKSRDEEGGYPDVEKLRVVVRDAEHLKCDDSLYTECRHLLYRMDVHGDHIRKSSRGRRKSPKEARESPRSGPRRSPRRSPRDARSSPRTSESRHSSRGSEQARYGYDMTSPRGAAVFERWLNENGLPHLIRGKELSSEEDKVVFPHYSEIDEGIADLEPNPEEQACYLRDKGQILSADEFCRLHRTYGLKDETVKLKENVPILAPRSSSRTSTQSASSFLFRR